MSLSAGLPLTWNQNSDNIIWKAEIPGEGISSPIVSHDRVFLTTGLASKHEVVRSLLALDFRSGEPLWETPIETGPKEKKHRMNTFASSTPVTDGEHVFVHFGDVLAALDREGRILWRRESDPTYLEYARYGAASSLVLTERAVIVAQDRELLEKPHGWLAAFDKETGEELWRHTWDDSCCSYTTPLVRRRGASEEILFAQAGRVSALDSLTGERLWHQDLPINQPVASAVTDGDLLAVFSGAHHERAGAVLRLAGQGKDTQVEVLWETNRAIPQTSSPVLYNGLLFMVTDQGILVCYDALTGTRFWRRRLPRPGAYRSSLVAGDGKIYALNGTGLTVVIAAEAEFKQVSTNDLGEGGSASPALAGHSILIRTRSALYRIGGERRGSTT